MFGLPSLDLDISGPDLVPPAIFLPSPVGGAGHGAASCKPCCALVGGWLLRRWQPWIDVGVAYSTHKAKTFLHATVKAKCDGGLHWFALLSSQWGLSQWLVASTSTPFRARRCRTAAYRLVMCVGCEMKSPAKAMLDLSNLDDDNTSRRCIPS